MPVTTPTTKLIAKIRAQNLATSSHAGSLRRRAMILLSRMRNASPIVSCGNR
jgi:hypothetical protein